MEILILLALFVGSHNSSFAETTSAGKIKIGSHLTLAGKLYAVGGTMQLRIHPALKNQEVLEVIGLSVEDRIHYDRTQVAVEGELKQSGFLPLFKAQSIRSATATEVETTFLKNL